MKNFAKVLSVFALVSLMGVPAYADSVPTLDARLNEAKLVLGEIMVSPDQSIPEELLAKAKAIAIYPNVLKGGFIFGARFGKGVVIAKDAQGNWGPPAFSTIGGINWGLQIGGQATDLIFVVMNDRGLNGLLENNFTLGADASAAAGPVGRYSQAATDLSLRAGILAYSRSRGLFAGVALDGAVVTQDNNSNTAYYGKYVTSKDILTGGAVQAQPSSKDLLGALTEYSSRWAPRMAASEPVNK
jgi:lipid-binding SYLF domain-containing protein